MSTVITEKSFYRYLKCPSWIAHEARATQAEDALRAKLQDDGFLKDKERELLRGRQVVEVNEPDVESAARKTIELMKAGVATIYGGRLVDRHWVGSPDILERIQGRSNLGDYYYIACDIKRSRHLKEEYRLQGCFYAELLKRIQGIRPLQGYVMHPDSSVEAYLLDVSSTHYKQTLDSIERILDGQEEPHFLTSDCKQSPWFHECKKHATACDDLSRLNRIWRTEAAILAKIGVTTVSDLAAEHLDMLTARVHDIPAERLRYLHLEARALASGKPEILNRVDLPAELPILVVDIESDPLRDLHYLFGVLVVDGKENIFHAFTAEQPQDEERAWREFIAFVSLYPSLPLIHYGWYEQDVFRVMTERYGTSQEIRANLEERGIDLLERLRESIIFPLSFYSLKDIAQHLGFRWRHDDASGLNSVLWFEDWLKTGDRAILNDILAYNEDDVRATWHVYAWALRHV